MADLGFRLENLEYAGVGVELFNRVGRRDLLCSDTNDEPPQTILDNVQRMLSVEGDLVPRCLPQLEVVGGDNAILGRERGVIAEKDDDAMR